MALVLCAPGATELSFAAVLTRWDAGDLACGELLTQLRQRLGELAPGATVQVVARDPGAAEDLPAWCRLTRHTLVEAQPPKFVIRRREEM